MDTVRPSQLGVIRFGVFELDPRAQELRKQGVKIKLQDQPFQLLQILLENPGEVVTREEVRKRVWPSGTFVDFEGGVYNAVKRLREALGDSAERPQFIETLPRKGYRFIASTNGAANREPTLRSGELAKELEVVHRATGWAATGAFGRETGEGQRGASWYRRLALTAGVALLLVGVVAYKMIPKATKPRGTLTVTRLTHSGNVRQAAISPDGKYAAYFQSEKGYAGWSLWLQQIATSTRIQLLLPDSGKPAGDEGLRFSPDGGYLYYTRIEPNSSTHTLYRVSVLGGTPERLLANVPPRFALSPDGRSVAHLSSDPQDERTTLVVVSINGSNEKVIAKVPQRDAGFSDPTWSHDGKLLAVAEYVPDETSLSHLLVVPVDGGPGRRITSDEYRGIGEPEWLTDGTGLVATGVLSKLVSNEQFEYEDRYPQLWGFPYAGGSPHRITNDLFRYHGGSSVSADSSLLVTVASDLVSAIWVGPASDPDQARAVTPLSGHYVASKGLTWTGAGKIVYWTNASNAVDLIVMDADGGNPRPLPRDLPFTAHPDACSDGHTLLYTGAYANKCQVMRQDLDGGRPQPLVAGRYPQCSPDSKWVVYYDNGENPIPRKISMEGGQPVPLTEHECRRAGISPDGKWVACVDETEKLAIIPFSGGKAVKLFDLPPTFDFIPDVPMRWTPNSQSLVYAVDAGGFDNLWAQPVAGGPHRALTHFTSQRIYYFAFSHDGKQIAIGRGTPSSDVVLISNFR